MHGPDLELVLSDLLKRSKVDLIELKNFVVNPWGQTEEEKQYNRDLIDLVLSKQSGGSWSKELYDDYVELVFNDNYGIPALIIFRRTRIDPDLKLTKCYLVWYRDNANGALTAVEGSGFILKRIKLTFLSIINGLTIVKIPSWSIDSQYSDKAASVLTEISNYCIAQKNSYAHDFSKIKPAFLDNLVPGGWPSNLR